MANQYASSSYDIVPNTYYQYYSESESEIFINSSQMTIRQSRPSAANSNGATGQWRIMKGRSAPKMASVHYRGKKRRKNTEDNGKERAAREEERWLECESERVLSQRRAACLRERTRMRAMNSIFDILRTRLPYSNSTATPADSSKRISKIDTLR